MTETILLLQHIKRLQIHCAISSHLKLLFIAIFLSGCASYKIPTAAFREHVPYHKNKNEALEHWLYRVIPRHRCQIRWYDVGHWTTWMLFGNDDDGLFGEEMDALYLVDEPISGRKALKWGLRNPLHNFCFYVIGSAHRPNSAFTLLNLTPRGVCMFHYTPVGTRSFGSSCSSFYLAMHGGKPFIALRLAYTPKHCGDFYIGWRERGNFGIKFVPWTKRIPYID